MRFIYFIVACFSLFFSVSAFSLDAVKYKVLVFGDSLSVGHRIGDENSFARILEQKLHAKGYKNIEIINRSMSGETTRGGLKRLPDILSTTKPNAVILELGINDVFRGFGISTIEKNLSTMINMCKSKKIPVLLVGMKAPPYTEVSYQKQFNQLYSQLAKRYKLILYPFFMKGLIEVEYGNPMPRTKYLLADKIHPNENGVRVMVNNFFPYMLRFLRQNRVIH